MKVAVSGLSASGKTALARALAKELGATLFVPSFKDIVAELGVSLEEYEKKAESDPSIDKMFDEHIRKVVASEENIVVASWLAIWLVEADLKVFLTAPEDVRAKRAAGREGLSYEEALSYVRSRDARNRNRYLSLYGIDIFKGPEAAHITLNNSDFSVEEEVKAILCMLQR